jgi:hypothetical protein
MNTILTCIECHSTEYWVIITIVRLTIAVVDAFGPRYAERFWITPANILESSWFSGDWSDPRDAIYHSILSQYIRYRDFICLLIPFDKESTDCFYLHFTKDTKSLREFDWFPIDSLHKFSKPRFLPICFDSLILEVYRTSAVNMSILEPLASKNMPRELLEKLVLKIPGPNSVIILDREGISWLKCLISRRFSDNWLIQPEPPILLSCLIPWIMMSKHVCMKLTVIDMVQYLRVFVCVPCAPMIHLVSYPEIIIVKLNSKVLFKVFFLVNERPKENRENREHTALSWKHNGATVHGSDAH